MRERVLYIDMAKGFAMITIVMLHVTLNNLEGDSCIMINSFNHSFNTRLLFFLSGMVAALGGAVPAIGETSEDLYPKKQRHC